MLMARMFYESAQQNFGPKPVPTEKPSRSEHSDMRPQCQRPPRHGFPKSWKSHCTCHHKYVNTIQFSSLWEPTSQQPKAANTKDAHHCAQNSKIFRLVSISVQNFGVHSHRTYAKRAISVSLWLLSSLHHWTVSGKKSTTSDFDNPWPVQSACQMSRRDEELTREISPTISFMKKKLTQEDKHRFKCHPSVPQRNQKVKYVRLARLIFGDSNATSRTKPILTHFCHLFGT